MVIIDYSLVADEDRQDPVRRPLFSVPLEVRQHIWLALHGIDLTLETISSANERRKRALESHVMLIGSLARKIAPTRYLALFSMTRLFL